MDINIVAANVQEWMASELREAGADLSQLEQQVRQAMLQLGARVIERHLQNQKLGYEGSSRACDGEGCRCNQKFVEYRSRTLSTLLGHVTIRRAYYYCGKCGGSCCPSDVMMGLGSGHQSVELAKAASLVAAVDPFIPAAKLLSELSGVNVDDRTVHKVTRQAGSVADANERELALKMAVWSVPLESIEAKPARLYICVDGVMVHRQQWNEAKCVAIYWEQVDARGNPQRHSRYCVRFESAEKFKAFVWSLAMRCGLESASEVILLGDGAAWIWDHIASVLGERTICITDWYHVMEHLWACGNTLFGQGTPEAAQWVQPRETQLWNGEYLQLIDDLKQQRHQTHRRAGKEALNNLITYLTHQGNRLNYAHFREKDYDIGSGRVESACKHVVASRMKRSGMLWSDRGAQEILSLRTAYLNGHWEQLWDQKPLLAKKAA
jgi:hypothetical protein